MKQKPPPLKETKKHRRGTPEYILKNRRESNERKRRLAKEQRDFYKLIIG